MSSGSVGALTWMATVQSLPEPHWSMRVPMYGFSRVSLVWIHFWNPSAIGQRKTCSPSCRRGSASLAATNARLISPKHAREASTSAAPGRSRAAWAPATSASFNGAGRPSSAAAASRAVAIRDDAFCAPDAVSAASIARICSYPRSPSRSSESAASEKACGGVGATGSAGSPPEPGCVVRPDVPTVRPSVVATLAPSCETSTSSVQLPAIGRSSSAS